MKAVVMARAGGTEVLELVDRPEPVPSAGQVVVHVAAAGVNFMSDLDSRSPGFYVLGSYAERLLVPAHTLVALPDAIVDRTAAAVMMQGLTVSHFATRLLPRTFWISYTPQRVVLE